MYVAVVKQTNDVKREICKSFLKFMYQTKYIQNFTVECGGLMPFNVKLTEEQETKLSPFTKNFLELYHDRTNNKFIRHTFYDNLYDTKKSGAFPSPTSNGSGYVVVNELYYYDANEYINKLKNYHTNGWAAYVEAYNSYLANKV